jgi:hypothetical protein
MIIKRTCKKYDETLIMTLEDVKTSLNIFIKDNIRVNDIITKLNNFEQYEDYLHIYEPLNLEQMKAEELKELQRQILKQSGFNDTDIKNLL